MIVYEILRIQKINLILLQIIDKTYGYSNYCTQKQPDRFQRH